MVDTRWLGTYRFGIHEDEEGVRIIELSQVGELIGFRYSYRCNTNHGYDRDHALGTVIGVGEHALRISVLRSASSSWEDLSKELHETASTERYEASYTIARLEDGRPVFLVSGEELVYVDATS